MWRPVAASKQRVSSQASFTSTRCTGIESALNASARRRVASPTGRRTSFIAAWGAGGNGGRDVAGWQPTSTGTAASHAAGSRCITLVLVMRGDGGMDVADRRGGVGCGGRYLRRGGRVDARGG